jgi:hypothetical protein
LSFPFFFPWCLHYQSAPAFLFCLAYQAPPFYFFEVADIFIS